MKSLFLAKKTKGSGLGYSWATGHEVIQVPIDDALKLILASHGDIYEVPAPVEEVFETPDEQETDTPEPEPEPVDVEAKKTRTSKK